MDYYDTEFSTNVTAEEVKRVFEHPLPLPGCWPSYHDLHTRFQKICDMIAPLFCNDSSQVKMFQVIMAYWLVGPNEKLFFILFGPGGYNGKSTLLAALRRLFGTTSGAHSMWQGEKSSVMFTSNNAPNVPSNEREAWKAKLVQSRVLEFSETDSKPKIKEKELKEASSGGDLVHFRNLYAEQDCGNSMAKCIGVVNDFPEFANGRAANERLYPVALYTSLITDSQYNKISQMEENPEILGTPELDVILKDIQRVQNLSEKNPGFFVDDQDGALKVKFYFRQTPDINKITTEQSFINELFLFILDGCRRLHHPDFFSGRLSNGNMSAMHPAWEHAKTQKREDTNSIAYCLDNLFTVKGISHGRVSTKGPLVHPLDVAFNHYLSLNPRVKRGPESERSFLHDARAWVQGQKRKHDVMKAAGEGEPCAPLIKTIPEKETEFRHYYLVGFSLLQRPITGNERRNQRSSDPPASEGQPMDIVNTPDLTNLPRASEPSSSVMTSIPLPPLPRNDEWDELDDLVRSNRDVFNFNP